VELQNVIKCLRQNILWPLHLNRKNEVKPVGLLFEFVVSFRDNAENVFIADLLDEGHFRFELRDTPNRDWLQEKDLVDSAHDWLVAGRLFHGSYKADVKGFPH
jgi:hypothetical protein